MPVLQFYPAYRAIARGEGLKIEPHRGAGRFSATARPKANVTYTIIDTDGNPLELQANGKHRLVIRESTRGRYGLKLNTRPTHTVDPSAIQSDGDDVPVSLSVADAEATEGVDETLDFVVRLEPEAAAGRGPSYCWPEAGCPRATGCLPCAPWPRGEPSRATLLGLRLDAPLRPWFPTSRIQYADR